MFLVSIQPDNNATHDGFTLTYTKPFIDLGTFLYFRNRAMALSLPAVSAFCNADARSLSLRSGRFSKSFQSSQGSL